MTVAGPLAGSSTAAWLLVALGAALLVLNAVTVVVYALDKRAARRRTRRVPERTLLLLGLLGGWPGAVVAQRSLRHKTRKASFRRSFVLTVVLNVAVVAAVVVVALTPAG
jgi:uncharacterized membrane protein YsdA (DUF1294 family)